jgi:hypothetical protein
MKIGLSGTTEVIPVSTPQRLLTHNYAPITPIAYSRRTPLKIVLTKIIDNYMNNSGIFLAYREKINQLCCNFDLHG